MKNAKFHFNKKSYRNDNNVLSFHVQLCRKNLKSIFDDPDYKRYFNIPDFSWILDMFDYYISEEEYQSISHDLDTLMNLFNAFKKKNRIAKGMVDKEAITLYVMRVVNELTRYWFKQTAG